MHQRHPEGLDDNGGRRVVCVEEEEVKGEGNGMACEGDKGKVLRRVVRVRT